MCKTLAAFGAAAAEDVTALAGFHTRKEAVFAGAVSFLGLIRSLRHTGSLFSEVYL